MTTSSYTGKLRYVIRHVPNGLDERVLQIQRRIPHIVPDKDGQDTIEYEYIWEDVPVVLDKW